MKSQSRRSILKGAAVAASGVALSALPAEAKKTTAPERKAFNAKAWNIAKVTANLDVPKGRDLTDEEAEMMLEYGYDDPSLVLVSLSESASANCNVTFRLSYILGS